ncbi:uncharacterized protein VDAG_02407 [Verticillium dahliae VdLs.17]|uniref:Zn(2)-C6 fungal-type domain-containing protein n=1 Tax=Verticillium dahliae (strain VdLs.17 / ATCC MYA-4575 / FGSC 10137) TaxID=498257 RepID=G2WXS5_VERDV|nr:uncharacterized protein VDAG_02407 [Verticillium dahliae VdLs.17]EGY20883.1 hypothetical protein VDAG_02407 [Verticillium dahliae VdLs.17]
MSRRILPNLAEGPPPNSRESVFSLDSVPTEGGRRQRASAACHECRKQKSKCSAHRPQCLRCQRLSKECVYNTTPTETQQQSFQRKYGELEARNTDLEYLFSFFRDGPETDVYVVLRRIRDGADLKSLGRHIRDGSLLLQLAHHGEVI